MAADDKPRKVIPPQPPAPPNPKPIQKQREDLNESRRNPERPPTIRPRDKPKPKDGS